MQEFFPPLSLRKYSPTIQLAGISTAYLFVNRAARVLFIELQHSFACQSFEDFYFSRGWLGCNYNRQWREVYLIFSAIRLNCSNEFDRGLFCRLVIFFFFFLDVVNGFLMEIWRKIYLLDFESLWIILARCYVFFPLSSNFDTKI